MSLDSFKTSAGQSSRNRSAQTSVNQHAGIRETSRDKAYLVGVIMGDASVHQTSDGRKLLKLTATDKEFVSRFARVFCDMAGLNWSGFEHEDTQITAYHSAKDQGNHADTYEVSKSIAPVYDHLKSYEEPDPDTIMEEFKGHYPWLLRGLWDAEGSVGKESGRISFVNTDERIKEIYIRLLNEVIGIERDSPDLYIKTDSQGQDSIVRIPARYSAEFIMKVNPTIERKRYRLEQNADNSQFNGGN